MLELAMGLLNILDFSGLLSLLPVPNLWLILEGLKNEPLEWDEKCVAPISLSLLANIYRLSNMVDLMVRL
jgi:hypothetical protein